jgi:hypothetical protein
MMWPATHYHRLLGAINAPESSLLRDGGPWCLKSSFLEFYWWQA